MTKERDCVHHVEQSPEFVQSWITSSEFSHQSLGFRSSADYLSWKHFWLLEIWVKTWIGHSLAAACCEEGVPCPHASHQPSGCRTDYKALWAPSETWTPDYRSSFIQDHEPDKLWKRVIQMSMCLGFSGSIRCVERKKQNWSRKHRRWRAQNDNNIKKRTASRSKLTGSCEFSVHRLTAPIVGQQKTPKLPRQCSNKEAFLTSTDRNCKLPVL